MCIEHLCRKSFRGEPRGRGEAGDPGLQSARRDAVGRDARARSTLFIGICDDVQLLQGRTEGSLLHDCSTGASVTRWRSVSPEPDHDPASLGASPLASQPTTPRPRASNVDRNFPPPPVDLLPH